MKKIIHHIRRQPEEVRRHILHILTIVAAIILLLLWVYSLGTSLGGKYKKNPIVLIKTIGFVIELIELITA